MARTNAPLHAYLPAVDAARGAAALLVLLYHSAFRLLDTTYFDFGVPGFVGLFAFGARGVDLFFVLSGFIIFHAHRADLGRPQRLAIFGVRRLFRIFPVYWAVLAVVVAGLVQPSGAPDNYDISDVVTSVLLAPTPDYPMVDAAWTLRHELLFYALFSTLIVNRRIGMAVFGAWFAGIALGAVVDFDFPLEFLLSPYNIEFFAGIAVALALERIRIPPKALAATGIALFGGGGLAYDFTTTLDSGGAVPVFALGSAFILAGLAALGPNAKVPAIARFAGRVSYPLYIVQPVTMPVVCQALVAAGLARALPPVVTMILVAVGSIVAAIALHYAIERPFQMLSGRTVARLNLAALPQPA